MTHVDVRVLAVEDSRKYYEMSKTTLTRLTRIVLSDNRKVSAKICTLIHPLLSSPTCGVDSAADSNAEDAHLRLCVATVNTLVQVLNFELNDPLIALQLEHQDDVAFEE